MEGAEQLGNALGRLIVNAAGVLLVLLIFFLIAREVVCWYWKINRIVKAVESIDERLDKVALASLAVLREIQNEIHETNETLVDIVDLLEPDKQDQSKAGRRASQ